MAGVAWTRLLRRNLKAKSAWQEASGSLGDIGTFLPLLLAMALVNGLNLGTTLVFTGLYNIITGLLFGVPMPVQPMKSIAAVAVTEGDPLTVPQIMAAGLITAGLLFVLGVTGLMTLVQRFVPLSVVRGLQLSQGISFGMTAVKYVLKNQDFTTAKATTPRSWTGSDGRDLALGAFAFVFLVTGAGAGAIAPQRRPAESDGGEGGGSIEDPLVGRAEEEEEVEEEPPAKGWAGAVPSALIVFVVGVAIAIARDPSVLGRMTLGPSAVSVVSISWEDWKVGFVRAAIPQIPLSILNSVVATCKLSHDLFPGKDAVTPGTVATSVGLMNLVGCWFGAMPVCHGAGGLAGQYRFGGRSGFSVAMLGSAKLVLGLFLGSSLLQLLDLFPIGLLGTLLFFSGVELAMACRDQTSRFGALVMLVVTVVSLTTTMAQGFGWGLVVWLLVTVHERYIASD